MEPTPLTEQRKDDELLSLLKYLYSLNPVHYKVN